MAQGKGGARRGQGKKPAARKSETVTFDYIKSNYFRVVSVNGIFGGVSPNGDIHMAVWSQRSPYPKQVVQEVSKEGVLGKEVSRATRDCDVIREVEAGLVFNLEMARQMLKWLQSKVDNAEELAKTAEDEP